MITFLVCLVGVTWLLIGGWLGYKYGCHRTRRQVFEKATGPAGSSDVMSVPGDEGAAYVRCTLERDERP